MKARSLKRKKKHTGGSKAAGGAPPKRIFPFDLDRELSAASRFHQAGDLLAAEKIYRKILAFAPKHAYCLSMIGIIAHQVGKNDDAEKLIRESIRLDPENPGYYCHLALVLKARGEKEGAAACYRKAIVLQPDYAEAYNNLANILKDQGRLAEAVSCYRKAIALQPERPETYNNLAIILKDQGRLAEAVSFYGKCLSIAPDMTEAHMGLGNILSAQGKFAEAISSYEKALAINPHLAPALTRLSACRKYISTSHQDFARCKALLDHSEKRSRSDILHLHFALGKMYDDCGSYREAFEHYRQGNHLMHMDSPFDPVKHSDFINRIISAFPVDFHQQVKFSGSDSEQPVFIVGMPRSGSSLVEQIIASHPLATGADELLKISEIFTKLAGSQGDGDICLPGKISRTEARTSIEEYLACLRSNTAADASRITDKLPYNFQYLGLIALLFPGAKIIHCRRQPLDLCLSLYFQLFEAGNPYAYDLLTIGHYFREYERLMAHWHRVLPLPVYDLHYEDLVENLEENARKLIDFIGLEWDDRCLAFHQQQRAVLTASAWQVRQPIYKKSVQRWKNYEEFLGPLKESLGME